jgi:hypothetical protein
VLHLPLCELFLEGPARTGALVFIFAARSLTLLGVFIIPSHQLGASGSNAILISGQSSRSGFGRSTVH